MNTLKTKRVGGLVLKKRVLEKILKEPGTIGLAFALNAPGKAKNVSIKILRVYEEDNKLIGEEREVRGKKGVASTLQYPTGNVRDFKFKFSKKMEDDKFGFGFYLKEKFEALIKDKDDLDEVFIGGGKTTFTDTDIVEQDEWFTFTISLRKSIKCVSLNDKISKIAKDIVSLESSKTAKLPSAKDTAILKIDDLEENEPELFNGTREVSKLILDTTKQYVTGIVFTDTDKNFTVLFKKGQRVKSVVLTEDQTLRKIILERDDLPVAASMVALEASIGWFPNADHTLPCPPHWPEDKRSSKKNNSKNSIKDAVLECLGYDA